MRKRGDILRLFYGGVAVDGRHILKVATVNGVELTSSELQDLLNEAYNYLPLSDLVIQ